MQKPFMMVVIVLACATMACTLSASTQANSAPSTSCVLRNDWIPYTVVQSDTLSDIAERTGTSTDALIAGNCLSESSMIRVGQTLLVPQQLPPTPVSFFLIIPGDAGVTGPPVGCGDSAVEVWRDRLLTGSTALDIEATLEELLLIKSPTYGQSGYVHAWAHTDLEVLSVTVIGDRTTIELGGEFQMVGVCADAQMEAQLLLSVFQYAPIEYALIRINGQNMKQLFDASGLVEPDAVYSRADLP